ncbi:MAG TPA: CotH kinase family protein, partial [Rhodothermales bacterium]
MPRHTFAPLSLVTLLALLAVPSVHGQGLVINEVMASNHATIADEDTEFSDWIELYNAGSGPVDLAGYGLTDDPDVPVRWRLPSVVLDPGDAFLVFASGKDRKGGSGFWETVVDYGHSFRYFTGSSQPSFMWTSGTYDDSSWPMGPSPLGYERDVNGPTIATSVPDGTVTLYLRTTVNIPAGATVANAILHVDYDDAFIAYLNGNEVARGNMPNLLGHNQPAATNHEAVLFSGGVPERFEIQEARTRFRPGENVLALKLHNVSSGSTDFTIIPFLTIAFTQPISGGTGVSEYLPMDLDARPHTNFKLDATAEYIILSDTLGNVIDSQSFTAMGPDLSIGRKPDGSGEWVTFLEPTPGAPNRTEGYAGDPLIAPEFSIPAGKYGSGLSVAITSLEGAAIYYTTNGDTPTESSRRYTGPIPINRTTTIRARAIAPGRLPSRAVTSTYLVNENSRVAVIALATDSLNLWDWETGIHVNGPNYNNPPNDPHPGANFWFDREIPVHVEMFEPDGSRVLAQDAGAAIYGAWSRMRPQKSLALFAREEYGDERFDYRIFPNRNYDSFHSIVLRNSGNDYSQLRFLDAYMQELVHYTGMETLASRPAHIYLNGEYWGMMNIREKANEHHAAARWGFDPDSIDVLEMSGGTAVASEGTALAYNQLVAYLNQNDVTTPQAFAEVERRIDVDNFIDYQITQIYYGNTDWPGNNHKFWRPQRPDGRFRWILYDTDFGFGSNTPYNHNTLAFATATDGPGWPNPPGSTFLLRTLLRNRTFRDRFINRFADHLNYTFTPERVQAVMDSMSAEMEPELPRHFSRWEGSMGGFRGKRDAMMAWGRARPPYVWSLLRTFFGLANPMEVTVNTSNPLHGRVQVNRHLPQSYPWTGLYFPGVLVRVEAIPRPGYRFVRWSGSNGSSSRVIDVDATYTLNLTAHFELDPSVPVPITISEIQYNPPTTLPTGDWVELHNPMNFDVDVSNWMFQDSDTTHAYFIPTGTVIPAYGQLVLVQDMQAFRVFYPGVARVVGGFDFGLAGSGETLRLYSANGQLVDEVQFTDEAPWPAAPDGGGPTLELAHALEDNANPRYWLASKDLGGTPGLQNSVAVPVGTDEAPELPTTVSIDAAYPNPFSEVTTIPYALPATGHVTLHVYNTLGQLVATLVDAQ